MAGIEVGFPDAVDVASYGRAWVVSAGQVAVVDAEKLVAAAGRLLGAVLFAFPVVSNLFRGHAFLLLLIRLDTDTT